jgi:hypothetical protein
MEMDDYLLTHIGEGKFQIKMENDEIKEVGSSLSGIIRYTYFEDYTLPEIGWQVSRKQLMKNYLPKMQQDFLAKFKPN